MNTLWLRMMHLHNINFRSSSNATTQTGWQGEGSGTVHVTQPNDKTLLFHEQGAFQAATGSTFQFTNVFRWTLLPNNVIRLEHLRLGEERPVELFKLVSAADRKWTSATDHQCRNDCYRAEVEVLDDHIHIIWTVQGPKKDERIEYYYR